MRAVTHGIQWPPSMLTPNPNLLNAADEALEVAADEAF